MLTTVFVLLCLYQLKHFLADYPLQRPWMLGKFLPGWSFVLPLAAHCAVHGAMTFGIALWFGSPLLALGLAAFDFTAHFVMDRIKASPKWMGRWKPLTAKEYMDIQKVIAVGPVAPGRSQVADLPYLHAKGKLRSNRLFWHSIGVDQMVHHLTHYAIIAALLLHSL